jgi:hypothetical protein
MEANYTVYNGPTWNEQRFFVVANMEGLNSISIYGFKYLPKRYTSDIGVWKIKQLKNK